MEDVNRLIEENAACKAKIEGLEADLERLMAQRVSVTESSEVVSDAGSYLDVRHSIGNVGDPADVDDETDDAAGRRAAKRRRAANASQPESAQLKSMISEREAANADLAAQVGNLRAKLARAEAAAAASGGHVERLQRDNASLAAELERANGAVAGQKQKLKRTRAQAEELAGRLREAARLEEQNRALADELGDVRQKLKQTQSAAEANAAAIQSEHCRAVQRLEEASAVMKRDYAALRAESEALRTESEKLAKALASEKSKGAKFRAQQEQENVRNRSELQQLRQWKAAQTRAMTRTLDKLLPRITAKVMNTLERTESAIARRLDSLEAQIGALAVTAGRLAILKPPDDANAAAECDDFIAQFVRGIKSIEKLSRAYANSGPMKAKHRDEAKTAGSERSG
jgi:chemotaxis protein MotB